MWKNKTKHKLASTKAKQNDCVHAQIQRRWQRVWTPSHLENHKNIDFFINTGLDLLENIKATEPAFIVGLSSAR